MSSFITVREYSVSSPILDIKVGFIPVFPMSPTTFISPSIFLNATVALFPL
ncbi:MAG: hypothetical protein ACE5SW_07215 [Nitrososphaeraceae archaeon]